MTSKKEVLEKITGLLKELTSKYEEISGNEEISPLEIELFEINAVYFAEHARILRKLTEKKRQTDSSENTVELTAETPESNQESIEHHNEMEANDFYAVDTDDNTDYTTEVESKADTEEELRESSSTSKEGSTAGMMESEIRVEDDEIIAEEDEIVLEEPNSTKSFDPVAQQPEEKIEEKQAQDFTQEIIIEEKEFSIKVEREETPVQEEVTHVNTSQTESKFTQPTSPAIQSLSESYSGTKPQSLNDRISALRQQSTSEGTSRPLGSFQQIKDIKSMINLNDKLLFIKDLFNGYSLAYSEAIELLNRYESFEQADLFLQNNYAEKNSWSSKKETVDKLYAILRKRYS